MSRLLPRPLKVELDFMDARPTGFGGWPALALTTERLGLFRDLSAGVLAKVRRRGAADGESLWALTASLAAGGGALSEGTGRSYDADRALLHGASGGGLWASERPHPGGAGVGLLGQLHAHQQQSPGAGVAGGAAGIRLVKASALASGPSSHATGRRDGPSTLGVGNSVRGGRNVESLHGPPSHRHLRDSEAPRRPSLVPQLRQIQPPPPAPKPVRPARRTQDAASTPG